MVEDNGQVLFTFWGIGDLHFRAIPGWRDFHGRRMELMFNDLHELWEQEGAPAFCASPGDLIETCALEDYAVARDVLTSQLGDVPFYPGVGNHEYYDPLGVVADPTVIGQRFTEVWQRPLRYSWEVGDKVCIMLDYPDPIGQADPIFMSITEETLTFLRETLEKYADRSAVIFLHCPMRNTVLDRDPVAHRDYNSTQNFFSPENSDVVRGVLAQHGKPCLFISGHTHSGWEAPGLVKTERLGATEVTFVNLSSPWYTGRGTGIRLGANQEFLQYIPDVPEIIPMFKFEVYEGWVRIRVRDHLTRAWLKEWVVGF